MLPNLSLIHKMHEQSSGNDHEYQTGITLGPYLIRIKPVKSGYYSASVDGMGFFILPTPSGIVGGIVTELHDFNFWLNDKNVTVVTSLFKIYSY